MRTVSEGIAFSMKCVRQVAINAAMSSKQGIVSDFKGATLAFAITNNTWLF